LFSMNCIGALRRCSLTFAALVRSCGPGLVIDCALIAHGADGVKGIGRLFRSDAPGGSIILNACIFTRFVLSLSVGSTGLTEGEAAHVSRRC